MTWSNAHFTEPACIWRDRQTETGDATTYHAHPGDQVTMCTATAVWTVTGVHDDDTVTLAPRDKWTLALRVHRAHLDTVAPAVEVDGQLSIFDALEDAS